KEFREKDVVFIGISVDEEKFYEKWIKALDDEGLHGIQLFANGWSNITKDYNIKAIPRFLVIGKNGNIISSNAPRPSNSALKIMIERALQ
ncbi:MAG: TlpA family protein disulfide reductase, partial [Marinifilaceae bacterium]